MSIRGKFVWLAGVIGAALAVGCSVGYATGAFGGGSAGVVVGCAANDNGRLRIPGDGSQCRQGEREIDFQAPLAPRGPQFVTVDCGSGQSINEALTRADPGEPLTITIKGTCSEAVAVDRDDVTLTADAGGGVIAAPAGAEVALSLNGARRITLNDLTVSGGRWALLASNGSSFFSDGLHATGATQTGVAVDLGSTGQLQDATIDHNQNGVQSSASGSLSLSGGTVADSGFFGVSTDGGTLRLDGGVVIDDSGNDGLFVAHGGGAEVSGTTIEASGGTGAFAYNGGSIHLFGSGVLIEGNAQGVAAGAGSAIQLQDGVTVTNNISAGVNASNSGSLAVSDTEIDGNGGDGVDLSLASSATFDNNTIRGNSGQGISIGDTSVAQFFGQGTNQITGNGGFGVFCQSQPAVAMIRGTIGTVSGNAAGQVNCPSA